MDWLNQIVLRSVVGALMPAVDFCLRGGTRYYWMYCVSGLAIAAYAYHKHKHKHAKSFQETLLDKKVWLSASARNDYLIAVVTPVLRVTILSALAIEWQPISASVASLLHWAGVNGHADNRTALALGLALTLTLFVGDDFGRWFAHAMFHRIPELWEFHKVHHSAEVLNFVTADRLHPVERITDGALAALIYGTINGLFIGAFGDTLTVATVMGANIFLFIFNICGGVLRHSPFAISFGPRVEKWIISPAMHHIHHSDKPEHFDRNYGGSLAIWDRMAGSLHIPKGGEIEGFGIGEETAAYRSFAVIMFHPFVAAARVLKGRFTRPEQSGRTSAGAVSA